MSPAEADALNRQVFSEVKDPIVLNLGAYRGEEDPVFRRMAKGHLEHIMVEPDRLNCSLIAQSGLSLVGTRLIRGAVGKKTDVRMFWPSKDSRDGATGSGSIKEPTGHRTTFPTIAFEEPYEVLCYSLDDLIYQLRLPRVDLLWMDVQGAEAEVIEGGQEALSLTRFCFTEAEDQEFYKDQVLKPDLLKLFQGWEVIGDFGYNVLLKNLEFREA